MKENEKNENSNNVSAIRIFLLLFFVCLNVLINFKLKDTISKSGFQESLKYIFKYKTNMDFIDTLIKSVEDELGIDASSTRIEYKALFIEVKFIIKKNFKLKFKF